MKAVNLLPASERPRVAVDAPQNSSTIVLVVLGALLVGVAGFVVTKNQVTGRNAAIATANQEQAVAVKRAAGLKAFGDFSQIKQTRVDSVTQLASTRFDWERLMRELALVLPEKVWLTEVSASGAADAATGASATAATPTSGAPSAGAAAAASVSAAPSVKIAGCAPSQKAVAETIVRLRSLYGAGDVELQESAAPEVAAGAAAPSAGDSTTGDAGCGPRYAFNSTVSFDAPAAPKPDTTDRVPTRLGGGA